METVPLKLSAVILDREGVITPKLAEGGYVTCREQAVVAPGVIPALRMLSDAGLDLYIASNQSCVARGLLTQERMGDLHGVILLEMEHGGVHISDSSLCPHENIDGCHCRKPLPGMFLDLSRLNGFPLSQCATVGDAPRDMAAGKAAGVPIRIFLGTACEDATHCVPTLGQACELILSLRA